MNKEHHYALTVEWTGNKGSGTTDYRAYDRSHTIKADKKVVIEASSDPAFRGDPAKYNPEELLLSSLSGCHMLWYLHLCADAGVVVLEYTDRAEGVMVEDAEGGRFTLVTLHPSVVVADVSMIEQANALHHKANKFCFIANSCNFPVKHQPQARVKS